MTFYLKYRPNKLSELDIKEVRETLTKLFSGKDFPHALLFAGPKGTGKTSAARIVAKILNCQNLKDNEPCNTCEMCLSIAKGESLDVVELDAASHRGIDDVRSLKEAIKLSPVVASKKVYIIDEAHMLTTEASNALLKTLEEPPSHVFFILATTNPEKLIGTIRSRATLVQFRKSTSDEAKRALKRVVDAEKIEIKENVIDDIVKLANGSLRDAHKLLEQAFFVSGSKIDTLKIKSRISSLDFIKMLSDKDKNKALEELETMVKNGESLDEFTNELTEELHKALLAKNGAGLDTVEFMSETEVVSLIELIAKVSKEFYQNPIEQLALEIVAVKWCSNGKIKKDETAPADKRISEKGADYKKFESQAKPKNNALKKDINLKSATVIPEESKEPKTDLANNKKVQDTVINNTEAGSISLEALQNGLWTKVLSIVKISNTSVEALLRSSKPISFDGEVLTLGVFYQFHKERLEENSHRKIVEEALSQVLNLNARINCILTEQTPSLDEKKDDVVLTEGADNDIITIAKEIFGN